MEQLVENRWNPVPLGGSETSSKYTITSQAVSNQWYDNEIHEGNSRYVKLQNYYNADCLSVEVSRALDIIAEDVSGCNADNSCFFTIEYPEGSDVKKSQIKLSNHALKLWQDRTEFGSELFDRVRETLLKGFVPFFIEADGSLKYLPPERFVGYITDKSDSSIVTHYLYDETLVPFGFVGYKAGSKYSTTKPQAGKDEKKYKVYSVDNLLIMKVGNGPFGQSLMAKVYRTWKQLSMLEDAIVIYRIVRSPERRIYYIDTGNLQGKKRDAAINKQRIRLKQKRVSRGSEVASSYDPHSMGEDIFIPTNAQGRGSRVETLQGASSLGETGDLKWFLNKLAAGLRVPASMTDPQSEDGQRNQFSDMRIGQMYQIEYRYMGHVKRHKRRITTPIAENFFDFCKNRGIVIHEDAEFVIVDSQSFALYKEMELNQTALNIFNSTTQMHSLSKRLAFEKYLNFSREDIVRNERDKLVEMGIPESKIDGMPEEDVMNLVYAKKPNESIAKKYNVAADGGGFF